MARDYVYRFCYDYNSVSGYFQSRIGLHLQHSDCNILLKPFAESIKVILFWRESQIEGMLKLNPFIVRRYLIKACCIFVMNE